MTFSNVGNIDYFQMLAKETFSRITILSYEKDRKDNYFVYIMET